ncbi:MAG: threonine ammonia-lyase, partial [Segatella copri]
IASLGGNITGVHHDRSANRNKVNACVLRLTMETRDSAHVKEIKEALEQKGFHLWIV